MDQAISKNHRPGLRLLCGLIALMLFGYLVEIIIMGAPEFKKRSERVYHWNTDPVPFWSRFVIVAAIGATVAYYCINWHKALPLIEAREEQDRQRLASRGPKEAARIQRGRDMTMGVYSLVGLVIVAMLIVLLIGV